MRQPTVKKEEKKRQDKRVQKLLAEFPFERHIDWWTDPSAFMKEGWSYFLKFYCWLMFLNRYELEKKKVVHSWHFTDFIKSTYSDFLCWGDANLSKQEEKKSLGKKPRKQWRWELSFPGEYAWQIMILDGCHCLYWSLQRNLVWFHELFGLKKQWKSGRWLLS